MKSKRPSPFRPRASGRREASSAYVARDLPAETEAGEASPAENVAEPSSVVDPEPLDLESFDLKSPESLGAVTPSDERLVRNQDHSANLPLLNSTSLPDQTLPEPSAKPVIAVASALSVVWALAPIAFAWGYRREIMPFQNDLFALTLFIAIAVGPIGLIWVAAYVAHQGRRLAMETRRAQAMAETLIQPAALAARGAGMAVEQIKQEIKNAAAVAERARTELLSLREVLAMESERLVEATHNSSRAAIGLHDTLSGERERLSAITATLDAQADRVTDAIARQGRMVAEASDLAETQIREAEAALAARAADLAAAAGEAGDAARVAAEDLTRQVARLETAGLGVGDQARFVEETLTQQRAALVAAAHGMRADHESLAAEAESQMAQLREIIIHAHAGAGEITANAQQGGDALRHMIAQASDQLRQMADAAAQERDLFSAGAAQSLGAVQEMAAREREALERQTRQSIDELAVAADQAANNAARSLGALTEIAGRERDAIEQQVRQSIEALAATAEEAATSAARQAEAARDKVDALGEAAFGAGQKADAIFEARLTEARGLIEQSADLVAEAGTRANARLEEGLSNTRQALGQMEGLLVDLEQRLARLPADAETQAETVRATIERSMESLMVSARRAADETQSIDAAFQDRVRRNYEMLSEAVRLMGVVAGAAGSGGGARASTTLASPPTPAPAPTPPLASSAAPPVSPPIERRPEPSRAPPPPRYTEAREPRPPEPRQAEPRQPDPRQADPRQADPRQSEARFSDPRPPEPRAADMRASDAWQAEPRPPQPLPAAEPTPEPEPTDEAGLRPRLRLTPSASDQEFKTVFDASTGKPSETIGDSWTWRELLSSMDNEPASEDPAMGDQLLSEIEAMGIDAGALLPRQRIEDIAQALRIDDPEIGRQLVRRLAPAAVRRLARRLMSDRAFRGQADRFSRRYQSLVIEAGRERDGMVAATLLGSDQGRAYLLIDAAFSEMI